MSFGLCAFVLPADVAGDCGLLKLEGRLSGPVVQSIRDDLLAAEERHKGLPPGTLNKLAAQIGDAQGKPLSPALSI